MNWSIVSKSEFGRDRPFVRLDAEFVDQVLLNAERKTAGVDSIRVAHITLPGAGRGIKVPAVETKVRYIAIDDVDTEDGLCFSLEYAFEGLPSRASYTIRRDDILVSNVRPHRGAISLVGAKDHGALASSGFTLLRLRDDARVSAPVLFALMRTSYARAQLARRSRNSMYPAVTAADVAELVLARPSRKETEDIEALVTKATNYQGRFAKAHKDLGETLNQFLDPMPKVPDPFAPGSKEPDTTVIRRSQALGGGVNRLDGEFFRHGYEDADRGFRRIPSFLLGEYFSLNPGSSLAPGDEQVPVLKQGSLTGVGVNWSVVLTEEGKHGPKRATAREGDVLLACTAHEAFYVGRRADVVREVPKEFRQNTCVPDVMLLHPRETKPGFLSAAYVAAFLRHDAGRHQVQRTIRGLRAGHVYKDDLERHIRIPLPPVDWAESFEKKALEVESIRANAKLATLAAVRIADDLIGRVTGRIEYVESTLP